MVANQKGFAEEALLKKCSASNFSLFLWPLLATTKNSELACIIHWQAGVTSILLCNDFLLSWEVKYDSMHWRWFSLKLFCWRREWVLFLSKEGFFGNSIIIQRWRHFRAFGVNSWHGYQDSLCRWSTIIDLFYSSRNHIFLVLYAHTSELKTPLDIKKWVDSIDFQPFYDYSSIKYFLQSEMADIYSYIRQCYAISNQPWCT